MLPAHRRDHSRFRQRLVIARHRPLLQGRNGSPKFVITLSMPARLTMATPFQRPFAVVRNRIAGAFEGSRWHIQVGKLGFLQQQDVRPSLYRSHHVTFSRRAFRELTFQVANAHAL
jgi:hypothetical protein